MIQRSIQGKIEQLAEKFPVISLTGPRQSGKTTLLKKMFPQYRYESLEDPESRIFAESDPKKFLGNNEKMIIDEIQRVPALFSYIQSNVDKANITGHYIISGSQSFLLNQHISQSLAGRVAVFNLLPLSMSELKDHGTGFDNFEDYIFNGFYPRLYNKQIDPVDFFPNYIQTYVERDVRLLQNIHDLSLFIRFLKLCAGRIGQLLNLNSLANDCGISPNTAKSWISVLEASFVIFLLQPHYINFNKRLVKMPKLYFLDVGLASSLIEIRTAQQISTHYLRGALFENLILCEFLKNRYNAGLRNNCYFWRDNKGMEIDCLMENGDKITPIEIKSGSTYNEDFFKNLNFWRKLSSDQNESGFVIYGGNTSRDTKYGKLVAWREISKIGTRD